MNWEGPDLYCSLQGVGPNGMGWDRGASLPSWYSAENFAVYGKILFPEGTTNAGSNFRNLFFSLWDKKISEQLQRCPIPTGGATGRTIELLVACAAENSLRCVTLKCAASRNLITRGLYLPTKHKEIIKKYLE